MRNPGRHKLDQADEALAMIDEEAGSNRSLAWDRKPAREMRTMWVEPDEGHEAVADRAVPT